MKTQPGTNKLRPASITAIAPMEYEPKQINAVIIAMENQTVHTFA